MRLGSILRLGLAAARAARRRGPPLSIAERLAMFPRAGWPVTRPVRIHWDAHQIPFIAAEADADLAVALGGVHAHLRLGQIAMARRLAQGRLSELVGAAGIEVDRLVRTLDPGRAVPAIEAALPPDTRRWLDGFVAGINHYLLTVERLPEEFAVLGLAREPWTVRDVLAFARLAAADITWLVWFQRLRRRGGESAAAPIAALEAPLRAGSNAFAVAGRRAASGAALLACDPHLSFLVPGPWLIAGYRSPGENAAGLMIPGLPFVALGRNPWLAWGGTSLHAASSDLVPVPDETALAHREEVLEVRWSRPHRIRIREGARGPVVTDLPWLRHRGPPLALRWMGHRPSDEITAMRRANRARCWEEFRDALDGFAVPGQRMLCAEVAGRIGALMAVHLPARGGSSEPSAAWQTTLAAGALPCVLDPAEGFIASANEPQPNEPVLIGRDFAPTDRKRRLDRLLASQPALSLEAAAAILRDVRGETSLVWRDQLSAWLDTLPRPLGTREAGLVATLRAWDGDYRADSPGALAFELLLADLARRLVPRRRRAALEAAWDTRALVWAELLTAPAKDRARALGRALGTAARRAARFGDWGGCHRLRLGHPLAMLPLAGRAYRVADLPADGGAETLLKTAHPLTLRRHASRYGSSARCLCDLSDPDLNLFVLPGGQDGWLASTTLADQLDPWRCGASVTVPLRAETAAATFPYRSELAP